MYIVIEVDRGTRPQRTTTRLVIEGDEKAPGSVSELRDLLMLASASLPTYASSVPVGVMPGAKKR